MLFKSNSDYQTVPNFSVEESSNQHGRQEIESRSKDGFAGWWILAIAVVLLGAFVTVVVRNAATSAREFAQASELLQIEQAIRAYEIKNGSVPPSSRNASITKHFKQLYGETPDPPLKVDSLDESEILEFWLGGGNHRLFPNQFVRRSVFYEIDASQTTDRDNDGFLEYTDSWGNVFIIRDGVPMLLSKADGTAKSIEHFNVKDDSG